MVFFSHVLNFIIDLSLVYEWPKHIIIQTFKLILNVTYYQHSFLQLSYEIGSMFVTGITFAALEKYGKINYLSKSYFKKSQRTYMQMIDHIPYPSFVLNFRGKVLYANKIAWIMLNGENDMDERNATKGFCEYKGLKFTDVIHPDQIKATLDILKEVSRESNPRVVELLLKNISQKSAEPSQRSSQDKLVRIPKNSDNNQPVIHSNETGGENDAKELGEQSGEKVNHSPIKEEGYDYFNVAFKQFPWKQVNCVLAVCENITQHKESYEIMCHNNRLLKDHIFDLPCIFLIFA